MEINLSVIIPVNNEIATIDKVIKRVVHEPLVKEVIIVDDFSTNGTRKYLKSILDSQKINLSGNNLKVLFHDNNKG